MDGFTDKLSQHFASPKDMISANGQAEATQVEQLQAEVKALMVTLNQKLEELQTGDSAGANDKLESHIHKENVRVYRNVQASVTDELGKQTEVLNSEMAKQNQLIIEELNKQIEMLAAMMETINDQQKSQGEAISGIANVVVDMESSVKRRIRSKAVLPIQIIILLVVLADLAVNVLSILGLLSL